MKCFLAAALCVSVASIAAPASGQIRTPYFRTLSATEVCGGFNAYCQPTSSQRYDRVRGADFGELSEWLGTSYRDSAFQRSPCVTSLSPNTDVRVSGENRFSAIFNNQYSGALKSKLNVDLDQYLGAVLSVLPIAFQAQLKADATDALTRSGTSRADFVYRRYDLSMAAMGRLLPDCYRRTNGQRKVVTGVSVVEMSGDWARSRLLEGIGKFEATTEFIGLSPDIKANYNDRRQRALEGSFQPLSFVIATSWRKAD